MGKQKVTVPNGVQEFRIPALAELFSTSTAYWYKLIAQGKATGRRADTGEWLIPRKQVMERAAMRNAQVDKMASPTPRAPRARGIASVPQFQFMLMPVENTLALYRGLVEELTALTAQVNELKEARQRKGGG